MAIRFPPDQKGEAIYVIGRNAYQLRENTEVEHGSDGIKVVLRTITGGILAVFGWGEKRIELNTATVGIRGSGFYSEVLPNLAYFCLCYGTADIVPLADEAQARHIVTTHHDSPFYIGVDLNMPLLIPAPIKNHNNAELEYLEQISGRPSPFPSKLHSEY